MMSGLTGKELFAVKQIEVGKEGEEHSVKLEFTFGSLSELEDLFDGNIVKVFEVFEGDMSARHMMLALWSCMVSHDDSLEGLDEKAIKKKMKPLITAENMFNVKFSCIEVFASYWQKAKETKKLDPKYQAVLDEMNEKQNKKK